MEAQSQVLFNCELAHSRQDRQNHGTIGGRPAVGSMLRMVAQ